jgi:hypothetical protein
LYIFAPEALENKFIVVQRELTSASREMFFGAAVTLRKFARAVFVTRARDAARIAQTLPRQARLR